MIVIFCVLFLVFGFLFDLCHTVWLCNDDDDDNNTKNKQLTYVITTITARILINHGDCVKEVEKREREKSFQNITNARTHAQHPYGKVRRIKMEIHFIFVAQHKHTLPFSHSHAIAYFRKVWRSLSVSHELKRQAFQRDRIIGVNIIQPLQHHHSVHSNRNQIQQ